MNVYARCWPWSSSVLAKPHQKQKDILANAQKEWKVVLKVEADPNFSWIGEIIFHKNWQSYRETQTLIEEDGKVTRRVSAACRSYWGIIGNTLSVELGFLDLRNAGRSKGQQFQSTDGNLMAVAQRSLMMRYKEHNQCQLDAADWMRNMPQKDELKANLFRPHNRTLKEVFEDPAYIRGLVDESSYETTTAHLFTHVNLNMMQALMVTPSEGSCYQISTSPWKSLTSAPSPLSSPSPYLPPPLTRHHHTVSPHRHIFLNTRPVLAVLKTCRLRS